jgi:hypothetical protein
MRQRKILALVAQSHADRPRDGGPLPNRPGYVNLGDPWMTSDRAGRMDYATLASAPTSTWASRRVPAGACAG